MADPQFTPQTHVRCEDCDIRGDLHSSGLPLHDRRHRIKQCEGCGGKGALEVGLPDPYAGPVSADDDYALRRLVNSAIRRKVYDRLPVAVRRRHVRMLAAEALMAEGSHVG